MLSSSASRPLHRIQSPEDTHGSTGEKHTPIPGMVFPMLFHLADWCRDENVGFDLEAEGWGMNPPGSQWAKCFISMPHGLHLKNGADKVVPI